MENSLKRQLIKNSIWNGILSVLVKLGGMIFAVLLARFLLPEGFGIYSLSMSIILILLTFADMGANQALLRYISHSLGSRDFSLSRGYYNYIFKIKILFSTIFSILLLVLSFPISNYLFKKPDLFLPLVILSFYLFVLSLEQFYEYFFYSIKKVNYLSIKEFVFQFSRISILLLIFLFLTSKYYLYGAFISLILASIITIILLRYLMNSLAPKLFSAIPKSIDKKIKKKIHNFMFYSAIGNMSTKLFGNMDMILIGFFLTSAYVGYYNAAFTIVYGISSLLSIELIVLPFFTQLSQNKTSKVFEEVVRFFSVISIPLCFGLILLGKYFIRLLYGYTYLPAFLPLVFLAPLIFIGPLSGIIKSIFFAREKPSFFITPIFSTTIFNFVLMILILKYLLHFSEVWAISGAAISTLFSRMIFLLYLSFIANKKFKTPLFFKSIIKPGISSIIMVLFLYFIFSNIKNMTLFSGILEITLGASIYFLIMLLIKGITKKDIASLNQFFSQKISHILKKPQEINEL